MKLRILPEPRTLNQILLNSCKNFMQSHRAPDWRRLGGQVAGWALDLAFPRACAVCGARPEPGHLYLCWSCRARLPLITAPFCDICGQPVESGGIFTCAHCRRHPPYFDRARAVVRYEGAMQNLVRAFKYHQALWLRHDFGVMLRAGFDAYYGAEHFDAITFVPLSTIKRRLRSFNQARVLAARLAAGAGAPPLIATLRRTRAIATQTHLTAAQRIANVMGVFKILKGVAVKELNLLLLDDVMTTGATVNACARVLKQAGAARVCVITLTRG